MEDKEKSNVGEGRCARRRITARVSLLVTAGQTLTDAAAASMNACVSDRGTVPVSNILDGLLQKSKTH